MKRQQADQERPVMISISLTAARDLDPEDDPRSARSGSWQALRLARRAGKPALWQCVKPPYASGGGQVPVIAAGKEKL